MSEHGETSEPKPEPVVRGRDIPPTRKHERPGGPSPTVDAAVEYPDDSRGGASLRRLDGGLGTVEQVALVALLLTIVAVGALQAIATKVAHHSFPWSFDVIRGGTFAIAMLASAYASQVGSHIAMDILTRKASARLRLGIRAALGLFTIAATSLLIWMGLRMVEKFAREGGEQTIPAHWLAMLVPIGGGLILIHTAIRVALDLEYLVRGKLPPERQPAAH